MIVYHYCTLDSFMSIISNKSIWLSDITKSNDSMEIKWITRYINDPLVKEVVIGPKCKARQNDVERFLQQNGFNCKVTASQGTYR